MAKKIAVVVGSLRKDSFNRKIAKAVAALAPPSLTFEFVEIDKLTLYNQDLDSSSPAEWVEFRNKIKACDGVLFATPEYNRGTTGPMKNAVDIGSRPPKESVWDGKPCAVISASPGAAGGNSASFQLRQSLIALNMPTMQQPEVYVGGVHKLLDEKGEVNNEDTKKVLKRFADAFAAWVEKF